VNCREPTVQSSVQYLSTFNNFNISLSKSKSHYDCQSGSTSWCWAHCGICNQILILSERCCLVSVGRPTEGWICLLSVTVSSISPLSSFFSVFPRHIKWKISFFHCYMMFTWPYRSKSGDGIVAYMHCYEVLSTDTYRLLFLRNGPSRELLILLFVLV
jgi:hypothetical protein